MFVLQDKFAMSIQIAVSVFIYLLIGVCLRLWDAFWYGYRKGRRSRSDSNEWTIFVVLGWPICGAVSLLLLLAYYFDIWVDQVCSFGIKKGKR